MLKPKFTTEQKILGRWKQINERSEHGRNRVHIQCVCGGTRWLYLWSWAGHGWAKCYACSARLEYISGEVVKTYVSEYAENAIVQYQGKNARAIAAPYLHDGKWYYDIETSHSELVAAVPEHELSRHNPKLKSVEEIEASKEVPEVTILGSYKSIRKIAPTERSKAVQQILEQEPPDPFAAVGRRAQALYDENMAFLVQAYTPAGKAALLERLQETALLYGLLTGEDMEINALEQFIVEKQKTDGR